MAKKTSPKKKAVKKAKVATKKAAKKTVTKSSVVEESYSSPMESQVPYTPGKSSETKDTRRFPIVVIVLLVIGIIVFLNYLNKKKVAKMEETVKTETPAADKTETPTDKKTDAAETSWQSGIGADGKSFADATKYCEKKGMRLPTKDELVAYQKTAPKELLEQNRYWTSTADGKDYVTVRMKTGDTSTRPANKKYRVLCKK